MEISHPLHAHPLFLGDGTKLGNHCFICLQRFDGDPFYACVDCKYYVHKSCAQLPLQIQHHFHQPHPLSLCFRVEFDCDSCHKRFRNGLGFRCSVGDFDLDVKCALMSDIDTEGKEFITHFTHQHPLTICSKDGDTPLNCFACKKTSSSSDLIYGCTPCDYFLHKSCSQISTHVLHAMHPQHALSLVVKIGRCSYCKLYEYSWKYCCAFCDFFLDVSCLIESGKDAQNSERSCFLCGKQHLNSNSCVNSLYLINQSRIQLPEVIEHEFHSHKPLLLLGSKDFECHSCHQWFERRTHYGCEECNFRMDVKCALMPSIQYEKSDEFICPVIPPHFNHQHPLQLISEVYDINCSACHTTKLSSIYGCIRCEYFLHLSCLELPTQIEHPLHDRHTLTIQPLGDNFCQICCKKYKGFSFGCNQCLFFIGIECIWELEPIPTVEHKYHCHLLCLIEKSYCDRCDAENAFCKLYQESSEFKLTKSYSLRCIECDYNLHFLCGPLPCTIKHKSHLHALKLVDSIVENGSDEYYCDICEEIRNPRLCVYYCENCTFFAHVHCVIFEIINIFKNPVKVELKIVRDLRLEDTINPSHDNLTQELLLDLLKSLDAADMRRLRIYISDGMLFRREENEYLWGMQQQKSRSEDDAKNFFEELSFYNDNISWNIDKRLRHFNLDTKYHIQPDECELQVIEVEDYKVTSNFVPLFKALLKKYGDFGRMSTYNKTFKSIWLYFLCRIVSDMRRTYIGNITETQLFTWLYYMKHMGDNDFDIKFLKPFLDRVKRSYFGLHAMKFEDEASDRLDCEIVKVEKKISELKTELEKLKWYRQQHRPGGIAEESNVMKEWITEAKQLKHKIAGEGIV